MPAKSRKSDSRKKNFCTFVAILDANRQELKQCTLSAASCLQASSLSLCYFLDLSLSSFLLERGSGRPRVRTTCPLEVSLLCILHKKNSQSEPRFLPGKGRCDETWHATIKSLPLLLCMRVGNLAACLPRKTGLQLPSPASQPSKDSGKG